MRILALSLVLFSSLSLAQPVTPKALDRVFELAGVRLLCEQTDPLLRRGLPAATAKKLGAQFSSDVLCTALAAKVAAKLTEAQLAEAEELLEGALAARFSAAELAVGAAEEGALEEYRKQLAERPPRGARLELVQRLDKAAHTTDLAHLLRYEIGKTQAWLVLRGRGEKLSETQLSERTEAEGKALRTSSQQGVESFMLFAYRQIPSDQLQAYAELYENASVALLLNSTVAAIPQVFAERRAAFK